MNGTSTMRYYILILTFIFSLASTAMAKTVESHNATLLSFKGAIGPASTEYLKKGLKQAAQNHAYLVIFELDTPGGLVTSMREMVELMLSSTLPVVVYVSPSGARATSAGTFLVYASNIAAMAPGTHLGSATPVSFGLPSETKNKKKTSASAMERKVMEDATAYIRSLAQLRGRNVQWGEAAVLKGKSLSATEALKMGVIDIVANNLKDLLTQINQKTVKLNHTTLTLDTDDTVIEPFKMDWRTRFLSIITDPNVAYILLLVGIYGLLFEFTTPGMVLPGTIGAIALLLALYALHLLPINYVGASLIMLGLILLLVEIFSSGFGILGAGGVVSFAIGSIFLLDRKVPGFSISLPLILSTTAVTAVFFLALVQLVIRSHLKPVVSGKEHFIGKKTHVFQNAQGVLQVHLEGEAWNIKADVPLAVDQWVEIKDVEGLTLVVQPVKT